MILFFTTFYFMVNESDQNELFVKRACKLMTGILQTHKRYDFVALDGEKYAVKLFNQ